MRINFRLAAAMFSVSLACCLSAVAVDFTPARGAPSGVPVNVPPSVVQAPALRLPETLLANPLAAPIDAEVEKPAAALNLEGAAARLEAMPPAADVAVGVSAGMGVFDGGIFFEPAFEPLISHPPSSRKGGGNSVGVKGNRDEDDAAGDISRRPTLSFSNPAARGHLVAIDPSKAIYGAVKRLRGPGSKYYWGKAKLGVEIDVVIRGENVLGRTTTVTRAFNKPIGKLTREDLKGTVPDYQLKAPLRQLRQMLIDKFEQDRRTWNPNDAPVSLKTLVRVIKFKSYLDLYRETHGPNSAPEPEPIKPRTPLLVKPEGKLKRLSIFLPRAVFLDLDLFDKPVSAELLSDIAKLQRTGVYFVAFSRKPYAAAASLKEKLIHQMSSYQLSILMPIRFMAVTDDGAVISEFPKNGTVNPVDVLSFSDSAMDNLREAARKAAEEIGISPRALAQAPQAPIREAADQFPGLDARRAPARKDPQIRFQIDFAKGVSRAEAERWQAAFESRLKTQTIEAIVRLETLSDGRFSVSAQRTDLAGSFERLKGVLGEKFGLYLNSSDILVLSEDPKLKAANPDYDIESLTGLKGAVLAENAFGLMLGEHRENVEGDLAGSASRISSFRRDRQRYMSKILISQDKAEQNINFFSGHVVHSANDWLVHQLQNGRRPSEDEYRHNLAERWDKGEREFKAIAMPEGESVDGMKRESTQRGVSMYRMVLAAHDRGEGFVGTEIPNFFMLKSFERRTEKRKARYILHTIFDFVALRPDPEHPGKYTVVIYDFKTGPAQSSQNLDKDIQAQMYAYFADRKWVRQDFPVPYLSGEKSLPISSVQVEFIYNAVKQSATVTPWDLEKARGTIIRTLNRIRATEAKLYGEIKDKPAKKAKSAKKKSSVRRSRSRKAAPAKKSKAP